MAEWGKGRSAAAIGKTLGTARNAVLGRLLRLRRAAGKSRVAGWTRAEAERSAAEKKREQMQRRFLRDMAKAVAGGMPPGSVRYFATSDEAADAAVALVQSGDLVLVKGSRGVRTDRVVERLKTERG